MENAHDDEDGQKAFIAFLAEPKTHGGAPVRHIRTPISHIFLAGTRAWKLKRARRTHFLDYSCLASRRAACEAEVRLNRRTAPALYLGMRPLIRDKGGLAIGRLDDKRGEVVDWLVEMRRFADDALLSQQAARGPFKDGLVDQLADAIAAFHHGEAPRRDMGGAKEMARIFRELHTALARLDPPVGHAVLARWGGAMEKMLAAQQERLDARRAAGLVRHCHGDLHLGNICLWQGRPLPFDAIEFSEAMAVTDIAYDLAFLLMDMVHKNQGPAANRLVNRYLEQMGDYDGVALYPLFMSIRAGVRALVTCWAGEKEAGAGYLTLAAALTERSARPRLVALGGLSGSGKSTLARALAPRLGRDIGAIRLSSDGVRKRLCGAPLEQPLPDACYDAATSRRVYATLARDARQVLASGRDVIADATFLRPESRAAIAAVAAACNADFHGFWLALEWRAAAERVARRGADASDATPAVVARQAGLKTGPLDWTPVDMAAPLAASLAAVLRALATVS
ncbi:MAG: AAA family ATPase [Pseudomonadota bacterium]